MATKTTVEFGAHLLKLLDDLKDQAVRTVIGIFLKAYTGQSLPLTDFDELAYLSANPDIDQAVRQGAFSSGFDHWKIYGRAEGRTVAKRADMPPWPRLATLRRIA